MTTCAKGGLAHGYLRTYWYLLKVQYTFYVQVWYKYLGTSCVLYRSHTPFYFTYTRLCDCVLATKTTYDVLHTFATNYLRCDSVHTFVYTYLRRRKNCMYTRTAVCMGKRAVIAILHHAERFGVMQLAMTAPHRTMMGLYLPL